MKFKFGIQVKEELKFVGKIQKIVLPKKKLSFDYQ
jgi:hypothetical protein